MEIVSITFMEFKMGALNKGNPQSVPFGRQMLE